MKDRICSSCGKEYVGHHGGKCPSCILKAKREADKIKKPSKGSKSAWKVFKKVYKHMNTIKPLEPRKHKKRKITKKP